MLPLSWSRAGKRKVPAVGDTFSEMASKRKKAPAARQKATPTSSNLVDEQLERYRSMRDFSKTAEPSGKDGGKDGAKHAASKAGSLPFVIQKHAATRLH